MIERDDDLEIRDTDTPLVIQMKLLRLDLRDDKAARHRFERNIRIAVALVTVIAVVTAVVGWNTWQLDCEHKRDSRESTKEGIIEGNVTTVREVFESFGASDDPRAIDAIAATAEGVEENLDRLLPPIDCSGFIPAG